MWSVIFVLIQEKSLFLVQIVKFHLPLKAVLTDIYIIVTKNFRNFNKRKYALKNFVWKFSTENFIYLLQNEPIRFGPQKYGCPYCATMMKFPSNMKLHIRKHTGEKPFGCPYCNLTFNQKGSCERHLIKCNKRFQKFQ